MDRLTSHEVDRTAPPCECPKCGCSQLIGPEWSPGQGCRCHPEHLLYRCASCGYSLQRPVKSRGES